MKSGIIYLLLILEGISVFAETPQFLGKMKNITAYEGTEKVIFTCVLQDTGDDQQMIKWFHNDRRATQHFENGFYVKPRENANKSYEQKNGNFVYKLTITNVTSKDSGEYKCQIGNSNHQIEQSAVLYVAPKVFLTTPKTLAAPKKFEEKKEFEKKSEELNNSINVEGKNRGSSLLTNHFASFTLLQLAWILDL